MTEEISKMAHHPQAARQDSQPRQPETKPIQSPTVTILPMVDAEEEKLWDEIAAQRAH